MAPVHDDPPHNIQPEPSPLAYLFRRKEGIEDTSTQLGRNPSSLVDDLNQHSVLLMSCPNAKLSMPVHGVNRIVNQVRPYLIELASLSQDTRQLGIVVPDDLDASAELVPEDHQGLLDPFMNIDLLLG